MVHVGEKLCEERLKKGYTLEEVSKATKIRPSFLLAIEKKEYSKLPQGAYAYGFVRNYARFLGLSEDNILTLFRREYDDDSYLKILPDGLAENHGFSLSKFKVTQALKILPLILILLLGYIIFQYRSAIFNPMLSVSIPKENSISVSQEIIVIGKTDPNTAVFVNSEPASLDKNGNFKKTINVFPGRTKITVKAINNFNKTAILERYIEVKI